MADTYTVARKGDTLTVKKNGEHYTKTEFAPEGASVYADLAANTPQFDFWRVLANYYTAGAENNYEEVIEHELDD